MAGKGAPTGNNNAGIGRQARHALELALDPDINPDELVSGMRTLVKIWRKQIEQAENDGSQASANMIVDRLDGRPGQSIVLSGDEDNPIAIRKVERVIVKPTDTNS